MKIVKTPLRISIGGGGTDLPFYYKKKGANLTFATINKNLYITKNDRIQQKHLISTEEKTQKVKKVTNIDNEYVKTILENYPPENHISLTSNCEIPSGTGLGSSGAFTVALVKLLSPNELGKKETAEKAFQLESKHLGRNCGKQDHYASAYGGFNNLKINKKGNTQLKPLNITEETKQKLEKNLMMFYTGKTRKSEKLLKQQRKEITSDRSKEKKMDEIKEIGKDIKKALKKGKASKYGELLDKHWNTKKQYSNNISNKKIDKIYSKAKREGAKGGKLIGAGQEGFLLIYTEKNHQKIKQKLKQENTVHMNFKFQEKGVEKVYEE